MEKLRTFMYEVKNTIEKVDLKELRGSSIGVIHDIGKIILLKNEKEYYKSKRALL